MDKLDLVIRSVDEVNLVHCRTKEVNLAIVAINKVNLVHRSDDKRSTLLLWQQG